MLPTLHERTRVRLATIIVLHPKATTSIEHLAGVFNCEQTDVHRLLKVFDD
jgi:hypothetical protein